MRKKLLAIVMSLSMILAFMPAMAFAEGPEVTSISYKLIDESKAITIYDYQASYGYDYSPCQGDQLTVVTSDGETESTTIYTYDEEDEAFISGDGDAISRDDVGFSLEQDQDDNSKYLINVEYEGKSTQIPVVQENNVSSITYTPKANAITLYKGVDEINETDDDGNDVTYFDVESVYNQLYGYWNDKVTIVYNDGTATETLDLEELRDWDHVTENNNGEYISLYEAQQGTAWTAGNTYKIYLKAKGVIDTTNGITVTIAESPYKSFEFKQSEEHLYVFEDEGGRFNYDSVADEYVLNVSDEYDTKTYLGSEGDVLTFTLADGSTEVFEYGHILDDPDYPHGWSGFVKTDASGNKVKLEREVKIKGDQGDQLLYKKDSDGHYINNTAKLTYMGAVSDESLVSYVGYQVWFDPNGGEGRGNTGVPRGMSVNELPDNFMNYIQPTRSGYTLSGWYEKDQNGNLKAEPYDFDTKIYEETFLYAKWEEATDTLATAKVAAKAELETYKSASDYREAQQAELASAIEDGKTAIEASTSEAEVATALANAKAAIDAIKTNAQLTKEENDAKAAEAARQGTIGAGMPTIKLKKPIAKKNKITIRWTKLTKKQLKKSKATHYEIWVSTDKNFPAGAATKEKILKKGKASWTCRSLAKNTKYYVRIRSIKYVNGEKVTGKWKVRTIKTKKK